MGNIFLAYTRGPLVSVKDLSNTAIYRNIVADYVPQCMAKTCTSSGDQFQEDNA